MRSFTEEEAHAQKSDRFERYTDLREPMERDLFGCDANFILSA